jgi:hypothetical protein
MTTETETTSTETTTTNSPKLMGNVVSFSPPDEVAYSTLRQALADASWDADIAREMIPRDAFSRAAKALKKDRVIDAVEETDSTIAFQLTRREISNGQADYTRETSLTLDKNTGKVTGENADLASTAEKLVAQHIGKRSRSDVMRILKKVYDSKKAELVVVSDAGGVYFVPDEHGNLLDETDKVLKGIGGKFRSRFRVFFGDPEAENSAAENLFSHLTGLITEWREKSAAIDSDSRPFMVERRKAAMEEIRAKLESYRGLLSTYAETIETDIGTAESELLARIAGAVTDDDPDADEPMTIPETVARTPEELAALAEMVADDDEEKEIDRIIAEQNDAAKPILDESIPGLEPDSEKLSALASLVADDEDETPELFKNAM